MERAAGNKVQPRHQSKISRLHEQQSGMLTWKSIGHFWCAVKKEKKKKEKKKERRSAGNCLESWLPPAHFEREIEREREKLPRNYFKQPPLSKRTKCQFLVSSSGPKDSVVIEREKRVGEKEIGRDRERESVSGDKDSNSQCRKASQVKAVWGCIWLYTTCRILFTPCFSPFLHCLLTLSVVFCFLPDHRSCSYSRSSIQLLFPL